MMLSLSLLLVAFCDPALARKALQVSSTCCHHTKHKLLVGLQTKQHQQLLLRPDDIPTLSVLRGGGYIVSRFDLVDESDDEEEGYDDYDNDDEDDINEAEADEATSMHQHRRDLRRDQSSQSTQIKRGPQQYRTQPGSIPAPYLPRKKKKKKRKNLASRIAKSSLSFSKKAVGATIKSGGQAAFYLMRPKSIQESEVWGVWRLDQQVGMKQSTANIELTKGGFVILRNGDEIVWRAPYRFITPAWPKLPRVEFEARAFQPNKGEHNNNDNNDDGKAWVLFYKGSLERKVADKSVIKMVGKLYEIERSKGMFGKDLPVRYNKIGSFVGRRRIVIQDDESDDEENDFLEKENEPGEGDDDDYDFDDDNDEL